MRLRGFGTGRDRMNGITAWNASPSMSKEDAWIRMEGGGLPSCPGINRGR